MQDHLGTGWSIPVTTGIQGRIQLSSADRNIQESIQIILRTSVGERKYRPTFGSRLSEMAFAPLNVQTLVLMELYTQEALQRWEPRIEVDRVSAQADQTQGRVLLEIQYHIKEQHDLRSLVYPFYLMSPDQLEDYEGEA